MAKILKLSVGERIAINNMLNDLKGGLQTINQGFKIMDKMAIDEKEQKLIEMKSMVSRQGMPQLTWNIKKEKEKEIELTDDQYSIIEKQIKDKSDKNELSMSDRYLLSLAGKMNMDIGEEKKEEEKKK
jgi:hypothetical protein